MVQFRNKNELASVLRKALEIERGFESMAQWEGYVQAKSDAFRTTLFTMISDSEHHATMVTDMLERLGIGKLDTAALRQQLFDFSTREEAEVMRELARSEKLALDTYTNIKIGLESSNTSDWLPAEDLDFIMANLNELILAEARHLNMAEKTIGKVVRIR